MKKITLVLVMVLIFGTLFTSCTKDDSGPVDMTLIAGKWVFNKSTASSSGFTIPFTTDYIKNEDGCNNDYLEIISGGIVKFGDYTTSCAFEEKVGTWTQSGNTITIAVVGSGLNGTFNVTSLSTTELNLKIDGTSGGKSGTFNLYFTK